MKRVLPSAVALLLAVPLLALEPVAAKHGVVASSEGHASEAGVEILRAGGNAVDAAVAVGFALAVTHPFAGNLGGGGFMLIRMASGDSTFVDYREEAPAAATHDMYLDAHGNLIPDASIVGALSAGVPGTVAGLALAEQKYGKLGLRRVLEPAIRLAEEGFPVSYALSESLRGASERLSMFDESRRIFLRDGKFYEPSDVFKQPELAATLKGIAARGPDGFYRGPVAARIVATMEKYHGIISAADLAGYQAKLRKPLVGHFRGYEIVTSPPPSSGGIALIEMLNMLEPLDLGQPDSYDSMHLIIEAQRRAYADRSVFLGDTDFVSVPVAGLTSPQYAAKLRQEILTAAPDAPVGAGQPAAYESGSTTHYSVVDADGNAVSNTYTLNDGYGSGVTVEGAGFLLNDEMDDFASKPGSPNMFGLIQGEANSIVPRKRPLSSMTPTIVLQDRADHSEQLRLVLGSPGGGTIINTVLEVLLNALVFHMDVREAVTAPRFHNQWMPDRVFLEKWGFSADTEDKLRQAGYKLQTVGGIGDCEAIEVDPKTGWRFAAADPRADGKAVGY
ncbi:MAG TPA: gamma-glutamyltransferase [Terriglobia bacterium]|nr:gamma-glutamyltransferase [Terriglobia bacterium]